MPDCAEPVCPMNDRTFTDHLLYGLAVCVRDKLRKEGISLPWVP